MIKLSNALLFTTQFAQALQVLKQSTFTTGKAIDKAAKTLRAIDRAGMAVVNIRLAILELHAVKNDDGTAKIENGEYVFESDDKKGEALKQIEEMLNKETILSQSPIPLSTIGKCELSPDMLSILESVILVEPESPVNSIDQTNIAPLKKSKKKK